MVKSRKKRVITKILKFNENNQYGHGMAKPLPTGLLKIVRIRHGRHSIAC